MNLYFELLKKPVFNMKYVNVFYNNMDSARSAIKRLVKDGMVAKIRNNYGVLWNYRSGLL